jgi:molybdopterin-guanine dinucleotide biosynthesis protein A
VAADPVAGFAGPLAGVLAGLDWAAAHAPGASHVVSAATDTPFFPADLVARLHAAADGAQVPLACAASGGRAHPVFGLWPLDLRADLARAVAEEGVRKVDQWTARHGIALAEFDDAAGDPFFNINTPQDLALAGRRLAEAT